MKIAVTGKGGAGKTTVAGVLARTLARRGTNVVGVDADPNPNLAVVLGMGVSAAAGLDAVTNVLLHEKAEHGHDHDHDHDERRERPEDAESLLADLGVEAPDGVRLIQTGIIERPAEGCLCCGSHRTSRRLFDEIDGSGRVVVGDLEAGVMDLLWVWPKAEDTVLVVTEPYLKSLEVARRAVAVTREFGVEQIFVVGNRLASAEDAARVRSFFSDYPVLEVPDDPAVIDAARLGLSPMDTDASCPAVLAIGRVADELSAERPAQARST